MNGKRGGRGESRHAAFGIGREKVRVSIVAVIKQASNTRYNWLIMADSLITRAKRFNGKMEFHAGLRSYLLRRVIKSIEKGKETVRRRWPSGWPCIVRVKVYGSSLVACLCVVTKAIKKKKKMKPLIIKVVN